MKYPELVLTHREGRPIYVVRIPSLPPGVEAIRGDVQLAVLVGCLSQPVTLERWP